MIKEFRAIAMFDGRAPQLGELDGVDLLDEVLSNMVYHWAIYNQSGSRIETFIGRRCSGSVARLVNDQVYILAGIPVFSLTESRRTETK